MENNNISACLVVRNEGKIIRRCLESLKGAADEIILVHDGEVLDNTLDVAQEFGARIFIRPFIGEAEPHRPFSFREATGKWILQIDADEFLSSELKRKIKSLTHNTDISAYRFVWPYWNGEKYLTSVWPHKLALFRKEKISMLGVPHFIPVIDGRVKKAGLRLEHQPAYNNFTWNNFNDKWIRWAKIQAGYYLRDIEQIEKFGRIDRRRLISIRLRVKFPLVMLPIDFILTFSREIVKKNFFSRLKNIKIIFFQGAYRAMVDYYLWKKDFLKE